MHVVISGASRAYRDMGKMRQIVDNISPDSSKIAVIRPYKKGIIGEAGIVKIAILSKRTMVAAVVAVALIAAAIAAVTVTDSACVYLGYSPRLIPIYSVEREEKAVALTFDAAWGADRTEEISDIIAEYDACATFFSVGMWADKYPDQLRMLSESGRFEIGTHSNTHPDMGGMSATEIKEELTLSCDIIERVTGKRPDLFRPPYGSYSDVLISSASELGLTTIQWDVDTLDWKGISAGEIAERVLGSVRPGSIVLMHNNGEHTAEALPLVLEGLKAMGYTFMTVGDMIYRDGYTIDHTGRQIRSM